MFTTAGSTRLTSGAKLCCGNNPAAGGEAGAGSPAAGGFWAQTIGDNASAAPRPAPATTTRVFLNQGWRNGPTGTSIMRNLLLRGSFAITWARQGDRPLADGLIRRNLACSAPAAASGL